MFSLFCLSAYLALAGPAVHDTCYVAWNGCWFDYTVILFWAVSAAHCRLKAMEAEMSTDPKVAELWEQWDWESVADHGQLYLKTCYNEVNVVLQRLIGSGVGQESGTPGPPGHARELVTPKTTSLFAHWLHTIAHDGLGCTVVDLLNNSFSWFNKNHYKGLREIRENLLQKVLGAFQQMNG